MIKLVGEFHESLDTLDRLSYCLKLTQKYNHPSKAPRTIAEDGGKVNSENDTGAKSLTIPVGQPRCPLLYKCSEYLNGNKMLLVDQV